MAATKHGTDKALNETFKRISNKGPHPYPFVRDEYRSHGGDPEKLPKILMHYMAHYPSRVWITFKPDSSVEKNTARFHMDCWVEVKR